MILVDTSVWIDHLRRGDEHLSQLLDTGNVLVHAHVIGELALGNLKDRGMILSMHARHAASATFDWMWRIAPYTDDLRSLHC